MNRPARETFIFAMTQVAEENHSDFLRGACRWYTSFLEGNMRKAWDPLFMILLGGNNPNTIDPSDGDIDAAFKLLEMIIKVLREKTEASLSDIVDALYNEGLLRYTDDERSAAKQLVFIALGWICMSSISHFFGAMLTAAQIRLVLFPKHKTSTEYSLHQPSQVSPIK